MPALSIVIPTLDAGRSLGDTIAALAEAGAAGLAIEIVVSDCGSSDGTAALAARLGARVIAAPRGRGSQLAAGAAAAGAAWLLFLHADTRLQPGWSQHVGAFMRDPASVARAGYFRFALDEGRVAARRVERLVAWRCRRFGLPYGDQGLLIGRAFYESLGGFRPMPLMEDVDLARRIGRGRLAALDCAAVTSAERYRRDGYWLRPARNLMCLSLYFLGVPPDRLLRLYR